jgi:hypothetical protein
MPALVEKVYNLSLKQPTIARRKGITSGKRWIIYFPHLSIYLTTRPGYQEADMPGGARKSRDKSSCEPSHDKSKPARGSSEVRIVIFGPVDLADKIRNNLHPEIIRKVQPVQPPSRATSGGAAQSPRW